MNTVPAIDLEWLVLLVNEFGPQPRAAAGESDMAYPDLSDRGQPGSAADLTDADRAQLAARLWAVFAGLSLARRAVALSALLRVGRLVPGIDADGVLVWATGHTDPAAQLAAGCAVALAEVIQAHGWDRIGTCTGRDCVDVYIDQHGRSPRRYCSSTCLNRAKVRAYRARKSGQPVR